MAKEVFWCGPAPAKCDISGRDITNEFIDGATTMGPWANMHPEAHQLYGRGLGTGKGQRYQKQADGRWKKVEG